LGGAIIRRRGVDAPAAFFAGVAAGSFALFMPITGFM
jgi:hypothetical protein